MYDEPHVAEAFVKVMGEKRDRSGRAGPKMLQIPIFATDG